MVHRVKIYPKYFEQIRDGTKTYEIRYNDRDYRAGDTLALLEFDGSHYTGRTLCVDVVDVFSSDQFLKHGFVCMSIRLYDPPLVLRYRDTDPDELPF